MEQQKKQPSELEEKLEEGADTEKIEIHVCKTCGQKMMSELCVFHTEATGHTEFAPVFDDKQLKGGMAK